MPFGPINSMEDSFKHPQAEAWGMIQEVEFEAAVGEQLRMVGVPVKFGDTKASIRRRPPLLGEHTEEILREIEIGNDKIDWLKENGGNVAVCAVDDPYKKHALVERLKTSPAVRFPLVIAPGSSISRYIEWGEGCLVALAYNFITVNIRMGDFVFINCGNGIGHDVEIGDYTTVYSHIDISGGVTIGSHCVIGSGATINPGVTIGDGSIIGSGSVVAKDIPDNVIAAGVPAKVIKEISARRS